ncbi:hypothetical protein LCGC14_1106020 [marine sediment metagenome]|uniref:Uncharacterized protein n=1 Tax=marine sediment metagenome TaxID=412755 RepID=A0A0F9MCU9_9ZZZZ
MAKSMKCPECGRAMAPIERRNHLFRCDTPDCLVDMVEVYWKALETQAKGLFT